MYSLDNLAQDQIIPSPRNAGKGHINLPSEGLAWRDEEKGSRVRRLRRKSFASHVEVMRARRLRSMASVKNRLPLFDVKIHPSNRKTPMPDQGQNQKTVLQSI